MKVIVRKANLDDVPVLLQFEQGVIKAERPMDPTIKDEKVSYYNIKDLINSKESVVYVVEKNKEIVASGYAKIKPDRHYLKHQNQGYLGFMFVPEHHRGHGFIKLIIDALLKWCKEREVFEIRLDVYNDNPSAIKAYEKSGFKKYLINMRLDIEAINIHNFEN